MLYFALFNLFYEVSKHASALSISRAVYPEDFLGIPLPTQQVAPC